MIKYFFAFMCLLPKIIFCQDVQNDTMRYYNANKSIEYIDKYITLRFSQNSDVQTLTAITPVNEIHLSPNAKSSSRLSFNYKFISFSFAYIPKFISGNNDNAIKGKTSGTGYGMNFNFKHWMQEVSYSKVKGYYLENTSDYVPGWVQGDPYIQFPQLVNQNFVGITSYNFNSNFSVNAVTSQSERQLKSTGSFIPHLLYRYYIINDKSTPTPRGATQKSNNFEMVLGAGYYHTFVVKHDFYFSLGLTPGAGFIVTKLTTRYPTGNEIIHQESAIFRLDGRAGLGYNGLRFFGGLYSRISASSYKQENTSVITEDSKIAFQLFLGYRLKAPAWLRDKVKYVSDKVGI